MDANNLTEKEIITSLLAVGLVIYGLASLEAGNYVVGYLIVIPVVVYATYQVFTMPKETYKKIKENNGKTIYGKLLFVGEVISLVVVLYFLVMVFIK